jgi:hypothetical protein
MLTKNLSTISKLVGEIILDDTTLITPIPTISGIMRLTTTSKSGGMDVNLTSLVVDSKLDK